jgi:hypothetical protein
MNYKPDEGTLMAWLYGELEGVEKEKVERYIFENPEARLELEKLQQVRHIMGMVKDKEVIAPPIVIDNHGKGFNLNSPYVKTVLAIAASLLIIMVAGRLTNTSLTFADRQLKISFGNTVESTLPQTQNNETAIGLTANEVQQMINNSLTENNEQMKASWSETQEKLDASIRQNLVNNSVRIDQLVRQTSNASQEQIQSYLTTAQAENMRLVKDYFQLTSSEQKQYIEDLLVDFAKYLQQQRNSDLQIVQSRLNSIEQNTDQFKQETEQILSSIISNTTSSSTIKN